MDIVLEVFDTYIGDFLFASLLPVSPSSFGNGSLSSSSQWIYEPSTTLFHLDASKYAHLSLWKRTNLYRQALSLFLISWIFGLLTYAVFATLSFIFVFDKKTMQHPKFLKNQVYLEIRQSLISIPVMSLCTIPPFLAEIRGFGKLYDASADGPGLWYDIVQFPLVILFTDFFIYWIHRGLHHPLVYKRLHKPHHQWIMPTPFAGYAFHPLDGFAQSVPYHVFPFLFPLQKLAYVALFMLVNFWTILIHDGEYISNNPIVNSAACHATHHLYFHCNFGQYTTIWDRIGGSYRRPDPSLFNTELKMNPVVWKKQVNEMEKVLKKVDGGDDQASYKKIN